MNEEEQQWLFDYEDSREKNREQQEENIKKAVEALKPIIEANRNYLKYAQLKEWFKITPKEAEQTAAHNALLSIIGRAIHFEIAQARKLGFEVLQDVNDHKHARRVADLLGLNLKAHEVE
jgi:hypothetical protein